MRIIENLNICSRLSALLLILSFCSCSECYDVVVVGGSTSGVAAALQSSRLGVKTLLVSENEWLGGMLTSAGVSAVDGNYRLPAGIWGEFLDELSRHYGGLDSLKTGWVSNVLFEPKVGNEIFWRMCGSEPALSVSESTELTGCVRMKRGGWKLRMAGKKGRRTVCARRLVDATELGDIAKACGVTYDIGLESRHETGEEIGPEKSAAIIQDLTYVAILKDYGRDVSMAEPEGYDRQEFACCCDNPLCVDPKEAERIWPAYMMLSYGKLPNGKYMLNWPVEGNDYYLNLLEMKRSERDEALKAAKARTMRFIYFLQHELGYVNIGLADDEYPTEDKLPLIPYHRESRRVDGVVRFTLNDIQKPFENNLYRTGVAVGDYPVDQHHKRYSGEEQLPDLHFCPIPSFALPLGVTVPLGVEDLLVAEKSVSVSNIVSGASRLQPVVLQIGQAAGALSALSVINGCSVSDVSVREVQDCILDAGGYLLPYLDVAKTDPRFKVFQRIGATGILRGEGRVEGWSNQTWLNIGEPLIEKDLEGLNIYASVKSSGLKSIDHLNGENQVSLGSLLRVVCEICCGVKRQDGADGVDGIGSPGGTDGMDGPDGSSGIGIHDATAGYDGIEGLAGYEGFSEMVDFDALAARCSVYSEMELKDALERRNMDYRLSRGEGAILIDEILDPFHTIAVDIFGSALKYDEF